MLPTIALLAALLAVPGGLLLVANPCDSRVMQLIPEPGTAPSASAPPWRPDLLFVSGACSGERCFGVFRSEDDGSFHFCSSDRSACHHLTALDDDYVRRAASSARGTLLALESGRAAWVDSSSGTVAFSASLSQHTPDLDEVAVWDTTGYVLARAHDEIRRPALIRVGFRAAEGLSIERRSRLPKAFSSYRIIAVLRDGVLAFDEGRLEFVFWTSGRIHRYPFGQRTFQYVVSADARLAVAKGEEGTVFSFASPLNHFQTALLDTGRLVACAHESQDTVVFLASEERDCTRTTIRRLNLGNGIASRPRR